MIQSSTHLDMAHHARKSTEHITEHIGVHITEHTCMYITTNTSTKKRKGLEKSLKKV
jgi:hypothetical protein